jgi:hypothetical protein
MQFSFDGSIFNQFLPAIETYDFNANADGKLRIKPAA